MSAIERLDLRLEEPGDDPLSDKIFEILCKTLQPDGELSLESAARQISSLLPEGQPYSDKVGRFLTTCYEVAEQIPYSHPSMIKLVSVIDACLNSSKFLDATGTEVSNSDELCHLRHILIALPDAQSDPTWRYQKLGETLRDWWDSTLCYNEHSSGVVDTDFPYRQQTKRRCRQIREFPNLRSSNPPAWTAKGPRSRDLDT